MKIEKVVGTTFTKNTLDTFGFTALKPYRVPKRKFKAQIVPEIEISNLIEFGNYRQIRKGKTIND